MTSPVLRPATEYVFIVATAAWVVPELLDSIRRRDRPIQHRNTRGPNLDAKSVYGIYVAVYCSGLVGWIFMFTAPSWAGFGSFTVPLFWAGILLMCTGIALRWYAVILLGDSFTRSVTVSDDQAVVETGPYAVVRHPTYTGILLTIVGYEFCLGTWLAVFVALVVNLVAFGYRIRVEEHALREELDGYADYCKRTPYRLVPYVF
ncbi:hypothetical protein A4G99_23850 [Haladaptatus sp. R4]|uniref:methyltransferase family protein n=1 Tax=Haladaptatus sp. R4 TaxID=1679489 RepID=UPI0007B4F197|nr:isoprenylcysteine carboxylmethyltransferase family protein [Haladaptatus sp. R4]KZN25970.1 hypothetical protein A4G99_23850 [Haladaptatus sp. R4]